MTQQQGEQTLYLASLSPRRKELLEQLNLEFSVLEVEIDETQLSSESPMDYVKRIAQEKASAGFTLVEGDNSIVIAGDTSVVFKGKAIGKPKDVSDAFATLKRLSGNKHRVYSAIAVKTQTQLLVDVSVTEVDFKELSTTEIADYIKTEEPMGKAGSYAIQGLGAAFIENINGSYSGVMGLPLFELNRLLKACKDA